MRPFGILECDPVFDDPSGLKAILDFFEVDRFLFRIRQSRSMKMLSRYLPRPFIEMRTSASVSVVIQAEPVNCGPCSVFMISARLSSLI